jgi:hypothetical protein
MNSRRRITFMVALSLAALLSASMLAPAFGAPQAVSAASLAKKLASTLKIAKRADKNAKRAIAGLQSVGNGTQGPAGPAGPKGEKGDPGTASSQGATGPQGPAGPQGLKGDKGDQGDACLPSNQSCVGPQGQPGTNGTNGANGTNGQDGQDGQPGPPGPSATMINVSMSNGGATQDRAAGPYTLRFNCSGASTHRLFTMDVPGGSGGAQLTGIKSIQDANPVMFSTGDGVPTAAGDPPFVAVGVGHPNPNNTQGFYYRMGGTLVLHNGLGVTTVVFDMFLDNRGNAGTCAFRGTAVQSGLIQ